MKTLVLGASPNPSRYSYKAVRLLKMYNHKVVPVGIKKGEIENQEITLGKPQIADIHTVTLYVGAEKQADYYDYILSLKPERIIFNPGTENEEFIKIAKENDIKTVVNCTLVMLNSGLF
ncbi:MAG: CoA-binding protein [Bacteroidales bacterium]|nr:CoA-binding protein [Bacteroidales bacterium]